MQISKLRLSGFKSFVQPTELLIEAGLTGIVGPNGCGKSNLVDALRWVMGESSARGLRGGEMDDVIFAGTHARAPFDLAEVVLQIKADGEPIPGFENEDELELSRRIGRGMGSVYRVNGAEMRAKDVQLLFADAASGARSAAIVGQGRIAALVDAKPMERRKLLEEAAGIAGLQARRHEAELKLQAAEANLLRVGDLLVTLDEQFVTLQKQARQAERYRKLQESHRETEAAVLIGRWQIACAELAKAEEALRAGRSHVQVHASRLADARGRRERALAELAEHRRSEAAVATELVRIGERLNMIDAEAARLDANQARLTGQERQTVHDLDHAEVALNDARAMVDKLTGEHRAVVALIEQGDDDRQRAAAREDEARAALEVSETRFRECLAAKAEIEARWRQVEANSARIGDDLLGLVGMQKELDGRLQGLAEAPVAFEETAATETAASLEARLAEAMAANETADARLIHADETRATAEALLNTTAATVRTAEEAVREREAEIRKADDARQALTARRQELGQRIERLQTRQAELSAKADDRERARAGLDLKAAEARLSEVEAEFEAFAVRLTAAEAERERAKTAFDQANEALRAEQAKVDKLDAEALALAGLVETETDQPSMLDRIDVQDGDADALAAALGDDLLGGEDLAMPTHWRSDLGGAPLPGPPLPLPAGCVPLADKVVAPTALGRRLAQVGLVDEADAERLQQALLQGQRLVSREGGLWRWDGLVRRPEGTRTAAARLKLQARRRELETELAGAKVRRDRARTVAETCHQGLAEAAAAVETIEAERDALRLTAEAARHGLADLHSREAALAAELGPLGEERERLAAEVSELTAAFDSVRRQMDAMSCDHGDDQPLATMRRTLETALSEHRSARQAHDDATRAQTAARNDAAIVRRQLLDIQERLERCRADERRAASLLQERAIERAQVEARASRLEEDRAQLEQRLEDDAELRQETQAALNAAVSDLEAAEAELDLARRRYAEAQAENAALRDRHAVASRQAEALARDLADWTRRIEAASVRVDELIRRRKQIVAELAQLASLPEDLVRQQTELRARTERVEAERAELVEAIGRAEQMLADAEADLRRVETEQVEARESGARLEAHLERAQADVEASETAVRARLGDGVEIMPGEPPSQEALAELAARLARIEASRERLGAVNLCAIDEARELEMRVQSLRAEQDELAQAIERLRRAISTLNREGRDRLRKAFAHVEKHFEALFVRLFGGGRAKIELTDMEDPLNAGLELSASPPGKKLQSLSLLSGGEKALTAIALIFAIFLTRPSPLCLLDEVDAPLDDANVNRLAKLLDELSQTTRTRFIVVTHHPITMAHMDRLYGVTMMERGVSQLVGVDLRTAAELRATA